MAAVLGVLAGCPLETSVGTYDAGTPGGGSGQGGGATGGGGTTGGGTTGGGGGDALLLDGGFPCLPAAAFASLFTLANVTFCIEAMYTVGYPSFDAPTWGRPGNLLTSEGDQDGGVTLVRWTPPSTPTGSFVETRVRLADVTPGIGVGLSPPIDLPFYGWTAVVWESIDSSKPNPGEIDIFANDVLVNRYSARAIPDTDHSAGPILVVGVPSGADGRLLYLASAPINDATQNVPGLYAADACSSPTEDLGAGVGCSPPALVASFDGLTLQALVTDGDSNVFVEYSYGQPPDADAGVLISTQTNEIRGFAAISVARGAAPIQGLGVSLGTTKGSSGALAAISPTPGQMGWVVFQPIDAVSFAYQDVVGVEFTVDAGMVAQSDNPVPLLTLATPGDPVTLTGDSLNRVWVGFPSTPTGAFVVLRRQ